MRLATFVPEFIRNFFIRRSARRDARVGQYLVEWTVDTWTDAPEEYAPDTNAAHAEIERQRALPEDLPTWTQRRDAKQYELTQYDSIPVLRFALLALYFVEVFGDIQLLTLVNIDGTKRTVMSLGFAAFIFMITGYCATSSRRSWGRAALAAYAVIVIAIAIVQIHGTPTTDDATLLWQIASGIVMVCCTVGCAFAAHEVIERLTPAERCAREIRLYQHKISDTLRAKQHAEAFIAYLERKKQQAEREIAQITAVYSIAYVRAGGQLPPAQPPDRPTPPPAMPAFVPPVYNPYPQSGNGKDHA